VSIKLRLVLLIVTSLLTAVAVSVVSYVGNLHMASAVSENAVSMSALRNHMEADMMHDALRADVYSAMLVGLDKSTSTAEEVRASIDEHAGHFRQVLEANLKLPINPTLRTALEQIKPRPVSGLSGWRWATPTPRKKSLARSIRPSLSSKRRWPR
jgi:methyl-accepting chemotaxis protein